MNQEIEKQNGKMKFRKGQKQKRKNATHLLTLSLHTQSSNLIRTQIFPQFLRAHISHDFGIFKYIKNIPNLSRFIAKIDSSFNVEYGLKKLVCK